MTDWAREDLQAWAAARGLTYEEHGLLPAATDVLRRGLGAGEHRAGIVRRRTKHSIEITHGFTKRPERYTENICRGRLPGGLEGVVAHHVYLVHGTSSDEGSWTAHPHTVVFAWVPEGMRVTRELKVLEPEPPIPVGAVVELSEDRMPDPEVGRVEIDGFLWRTDPPEEERAVNEMARGVAAELLAAPEGTRVEMRDGCLCVSVLGVVEDHATLDGLCELASRVAGGVRRAAAMHPSLDASTPALAGGDSPHMRWIERKAAEIPWHTPPANVPVAAAAYAQGLAGHRRSTRWKTTGIAAAAIVVLLLIWFAIDVVIALAFDMPGAAAIAAIIGLFSIPFAIGKAVRFGSEAADADVTTRSRLCGLEAFARAYAQARGMTLEDRDELRRRFASPVPGAPLKSLHGRIGGGGDVIGRIVLWIARDERWQVRYWNMAVVPAAGGGAEPAQVPGFQVWRVGDLVVVAEPVPDEGRSIERLDALAAAARQAVAPSAVPAG